MRDIKWIGVPVLILTLATSTAAQDALSFDVSVGIFASGTHCFVIGRDGETTTVLSIVEVSGPGFASSQCIREVWSGDAVVDYRSSYRQSGIAARFSPLPNESAVRLRVEGGQLFGTGGPIPSNAVPHTFWNRRAIAARRFIDTICGGAFSVTSSVAGNVARYAGTRPASPCGTSERPSAEWSAEVRYDRSSKLKMLILRDAQEVRYRRVAEDLEVCEGRLDAQACSARLR